MKQTITSPTMEKNRAFYQNYIAPMLKQEFPEYENHIAVGVVGEGSDCFGYDDLISQDHDFGIGVCLWLTEEDAQAIGPQLQAEYQKQLELWYRTNVTESAFLSPQELRIRLMIRRGVQTTSQFYTGLLGFKLQSTEPLISNASWFYTEEWRFATATNGVVFRDDLGEFSRIRQTLLSHYPDRIFRMRLANALHEFSGAMQANYARCMSRGDLVAANFCKSRSIEAAMDILFLLNHRFAPYYKWKFKAFTELPNSADISNLLTAASMELPSLEAWKDVDYDARRVNTQDPLVNTFEKIASLIANQLYDAGLTRSKEVFLEAHCQDIGNGI